MNVTWWRSKQLKTVKKIEESMMRRVRARKETQAMDRRSRLMTGASRDGPFEEVPLKLPSMRVRRVVLVGL